MYNVPIYKYITYWYIYFYWSQESGIQTHYNYNRYVNFVEMIHLSYNNSGVTISVIVIIITVFTIFTHVIIFFISIRNLQSVLRAQ